MRLTQVWEEEETDTHPPNDVMLGRCRFKAIDANADDFNVADNLATFHVPGLIYPVFHFGHGRHITSAYDSLSVTHSIPGI